MPAGPIASTANALPDVRNAVYRQWDAAGQLRLYIGDRLFPELVVESDAVVHKRIKREEFMKPIASLLREKGTYPQYEFGFDDFNILTEEHGLKAPIDAKAAASASRYFDARQVAAGLILYRGWMTAEQHRATLLENTSTWANQAVSNGAWSTHASAHPVADLLDVIRDVYEASGFFPNTVHIPGKAFQNLIQCAEYLDRIGASDSRDVKGAMGSPDDLASKAALAAMIRVPAANIMISEGLKPASTHVEGKTIATSYIWDTTKVWVGYVDPAPTGASNTAIWGAHWTGDGSEWNWRLEEYWHEDARCNYVRVRRQVKPQVVDAALGKIITGVL